MEEVGHESVRIRAVPVGGESGNIPRGKSSPLTCLNRLLFFFKTHHIHLIFQIH